ncbi:MAG TPA: hypothetical protein VFW02_09935, partial [Candidatus Limnocylindrales bacterium]|nr:hypothetical protein [Candidatus Limnocylindrales bacterium]
MSESDKPQRSVSGPTEETSGFLGLDDVRRVARPARQAIHALRDGVAAAADGVAAAAEPIVDRVQGVIDGAERTWHERPGARVRRVRRMGAQPLPYLYEVHPEARRARPVQVGLQTIDVADIAGTSVGGGDQRGGDFLPLKPFRGKNWSGRWQRLRQAQDRLAVLPPIDVVKHADRYWVEDGHNRVALALYGGQVGIDASVVELVPMGGTRTEPIGSLATTAADSRSVRTAGSGHRPSDALSRNEPMVGEPPGATPRRAGP